MPAALPKRNCPQSRMFGDQGDLLVYGELAKALPSRDAGQEYEIDLPSFCRATLPPGWPKIDVSPDGSLFELTRRTGCPCLVVFGPSTKIKASRIKQTLLGHGRTNIQWAAIRRRRNPRCLRSINQGSRSGGELALGQAGPSKGYDSLHGQIANGLAGDSLGDLRGSLPRQARQFHFKRFDGNGVLANTANTGPPNRIGPNTIPAPLLFITRGPPSPNLTRNVDARVFIPQNHGAVHPRWHVFIYGPAQI